MLFQEIEDPRLRRVADMFIDPKRMPKDYSAEAKDVCADNRLAFLGFNNYFTLIPSTCRIVQIPTPVATNLVGIPLKDGSQLKKVFNKMWVYRKKKQKSIIDLHMLSRKKNLNSITKLKRCVYNGKT